MQHQVPQFGRSDNDRNTYVANTWETSAFCRDYLFWILLSRRHRSMFYDNVLPIVSCASILSSWICSWAVLMCRTILISQSMMNDWLVTEYTGTQVQSIQQRDTTLAEHWFASLFIPTLRRKVTNRKSSGQISLLEMWFLAVLKWFQRWNLNAEFVTNQFLYLLVCMSWVSLIIRNVKCSFHCFLGIIQQNSPCTIESFSAE